MLAKRHLRFGWWSFLVFTSLGLGLEALHGFKVQMYLNAANETRRLMWTLAHAHGALLGLVHVVVGLSFRSTPALASAHQKLISRSFIGASVLLPGGFFLGGVRFYAGDPGMGAALVPVGAALLLLGTVLLARGAGALDSPQGARKG